jgi:hypothetical protein
MGKHKGKEFIVGKQEKCTMAHGSKEQSMGLVFTRNSLERNILESGETTMLKGMGS